MIPSKLAAIATVAFCLATPARAATCPAVTFAPTSLTITDWNPLGTAAVTATITATVAASASYSSIQVILVDNETGTTRIGVAGPEYNAVNGSTVISYPSGTVASSTTAPRTNLDNKNATPITLNLTVRGNTDLTDYVGGMEIAEQLRYSATCYKGGNGSNAPDSDTNVPAGPNVKVVVPKVISLQSASAVPLNFNNFTALSDTANIVLKSTSSINVLVSTQYGTTSSNQMVLAGVTAPYPTNTVIPYALTLNGTSIFKNTQLLNQTRGGQAGITYPLRLTLPNAPAGKVAGDYADTITLTLSAGS